MVYKRLIPFFLILIASSFITGCNDKTGALDDGLSLLETEVFYDQKITLPKGAKLEVNLDDISKMDVASILISSAAREIKGSPPHSLQIAFPSKKIKNNNRYSLRASIKVDDKLYFISTTQVNPFAVGIASPIEIKVDLLDNSVSSE
jgi:putative lipoprotein